MRRLGLLANLLLVGALTVAGCGSDAQDGDTGGAETGAEAGAETSSTPAAETVLLIAPEDAGTGRCMAPSADVLAQADVAFDGTVRSVEHGLVDLEVGTWYAGGDGDLVTVRAQPGAMQALIGAVAFEEGGRFLVAGQGSDLMVCGLSAAYDEQLAALYAEAFGG